MGPELVSTIPDSSTPARPLNSPKQPCDVAVRLKDALMPTETLSVSGQVLTTTNNNLNT